MAAMRTPLRSEPVQLKRLIKSGIGFPTGLVNNPTTRLSEDEPLNTRG